MADVQEIIHNGIDPFINTEDTYFIIVDECDDQSKAGGLVNVLYNADPTKKSILIHSVYVDYDIDAASLANIILEATTKHKLKKKNFSGFYGDSTRYLVECFVDIQIFFKFALSFPEPSHLLILPVKYIFDKDYNIRYNLPFYTFFEDVMSWFVSSRNNFKNSKKKNYIHEIKQRALTKQSIKKILGLYYRSPSMEYMDDMYEVQISSSSNTQNIDMEEDDGDDDEDAADDDDDLRIAEDKKQSDNEVELVSDTDDDDSNNDDEDAKQIKLSDQDKKIKLSLFKCLPYKVITSR